MYFSYTSRGDRNSSLPLRAAFLLGSCPGRAVGHLCHLLTLCSSTGENLKAPGKSRSSHRTRNKRGRARASKDTSKLLLLYDEDILERDPLREQKDLAFAQAYLTRVRQNRNSRDLGSSDTKLSHRTAGSDWEYWSGWAGVISSYTPCVVLHFPNCPCLEL